MAAKKEQPTRTCIHPHTRLRAREAFFSHICDLCVSVDRSSYKFTNNVPEESKTEKEMFPQSSNLLVRCFFTEVEKPMISAWASW